MLCPYCFMAGRHSIFYSVSLETCLCANKCSKGTVPPTEPRPCDAKRFSSSSLAPEWLTHGFSEHSTLEYDKKVYHTVKAVFETWGHTSSDDTISLNPLSLQAPYLCTLGCDEWIYNETQLLNYRKQSLGKCRKVFILFRLFFFFA